MIFSSDACVVEIEAENRAEAVPQGRAEQGKARGGADQGKLGQVQAQALGARPLADDDVQGEVFQRRVEYFLHGAVQAVDFIDEEDILAAEVGQDGRQVAGALDGRAGGGLDVDAHLGGDDVGQGGLAQAGRPVEQDVVDRLAPAFGGGNGNFRFSLILSCPMKSARLRGRRLVSSGASSSLGLPEIMRAISLHPLKSLSSSLLKQAIRGRIYPSYASFLQ